MKNHRGIYLVCFIAISAFILGCNSKPRPKFEEGFKATNFFDGKSLDGWEISNFGPQGPVYISGGSIILGMGDGCTGVSWKGDFPTIDYEVKLEAKQIDGNDFFCGMTFPVNDEFCTLIIGGWTGTVTGLSNIDGHDASENETTIYKEYKRNIWYRIKLRVTPEHINAWVNDTSIVDVDIRGKELSIRPEVSLSKPFGIASWQTTAAIRNIEVARF
ncbi:3-keto-disaccharide hydrolase [Sunxiuqinia sp. A32]|uniref:3-keto-disaccharide hydrolase n=1 Tax=Sunxiuqinia sp. A32 TaxID=3461496 RepID=UPI0040464CE9